MKKVFIGILFSAFVATGAFAQDQQPKPDQPGDHPGFAQPHRGGFNHFDMMAKLNLTDQQKGELKAINEDFRKQMTELNKNEDITVREWKSKMATIRKDHKDKVEGVLTDEQKASMKKMAEDRKSRFGMMGPQRLEKMKKDLNLTDDQMAKLKKSHEDMAQQMKAIHDDKSLSDDQRKSKMQDLRKQQHEALKSILTPDQLQKLEQHKPHGQQPPAQQ